MKWLILGALLGILILTTPALAHATTAITQPTALAFAAGVLARPALARRMRGWWT